MIFSVTFMFSEEPTVDEINHATDLYQRAGEEFDQAQNLYTSANTVMSKADAGEDVSVNEINKASDEFEKASQIFAQAETDYKDANKILNFSEPQEPQPAATPVMEQASAAPAEPFLLYTSHYATDKDTLTNDEKEMIQAMVLDLGDPTAVTYTINGYADSVYTDAYNQLLSVKRANGVMDYLIYLGVSKENIIVKGYGENDPIADNKTEEGRKENRRVEIYVK